MKNQIIYLGIALMTMCSTVTNASTQMESFDAAQTEIDSFKVKGAAGKTYYVVNESSVLNPELLLEASYSRSIDEVISEDNAITERFAATDLPMFQSKSIEDLIQADNQIIEATIPMIQPLMNANPSIHCEKVTAAE